MLVLSRRSGEALTIGEGIRLRVLEIDGSRVRLGIEAPDDVRILREELCFWQGGAALTEIAQRASG